MKILPLVAGCALFAEALHYAVPFDDSRQARLDCKIDVKQLFIKGKTVDLDNKHKRLYEKYLNRP